jgi:hypothetical protein
MYLMRFKEDRIKSIAAEFQEIKKLDTAKENDQDNICWANDISYNKRDVNLVEFTIVEKNIKRRYVFITNINIKKRNVEHIVAMGRSRWKIENQGFNNQKNIRYNIEHANSLDYTAMKNHYLLTQIADILMQLYENGSVVLKMLKKTAKEISSNLLEAIRTRRLTDEDIQHIANATQVRFT